MSQGLLCHKRRILPYVHLKAMVLNDNTLDDIETVINPDEFVHIIDSAGVVGRVEEQELLHRVVKALHKEDNSGHAVLVDGPVGCGKTHFIQSTSRMMQRNAEEEDEEEEREVFWVSGKYQEDPKKRSRYTGLVDALTGLCYLIKSNFRSDEIKGRIQTELSADELQVLQMLVPTVGYLMDEEQEEQAQQTEGTTFSYQMFLAIVRRFLCAAASSNNPVVIFLDDFQNADEESVSMLNGFLASQKLGHVLIIVAMETDSNVQFPVSEHTPIPVFKLTLGPFDEQDINEMLSTMLDLHPMETRELSELVLHRTTGSPALVVQFVDMLLRQGYIHRSEDEATFAFDLVEVRNKTHLVEDAAHMYSEKMKTMPHDVQLMLVSASLLGHTFTSEVLEAMLQSIELVTHFPAKLGRPKNSADEAVSKSSHSAMIMVDVPVCLKKAAGAGLIERLSKGKYRFVHERVQQAAGALLPAGEEGDKIKGRVGKSLLNLSRSSAEGWMLYAATNLLAKYPSTVPPRTIAELCLEAAKSSQEQSAFRSAGNYSDYGIKMLGGKAWVDHYTLALSLFNLGAEMHYANGNLEKAEKRSRHIQKHSKAPEDAYYSTSVLVNVLFAQEEFDKAATLLREHLIAMGIQPPKKKLGWLTAVSQVSSSKRLLKGRTPKQLENDLPTCTDPSKVHLLRLLHLFAHATYQTAEKDVFSVTCQTLFQETLKLGIGPYSGNAMAFFATTLALTKEIKPAYSFGCMAMKLTIKRPELQKHRAEVAVIHYSFLAHIGEPLRNSFIGLEDAFTAGFKVGDLYSACSCLAVRSALGIVVGMSLHDYERYAKKIGMYLFEQSKADPA